MTKLSLDYTTGVMHPRETFAIAGTIAAINSELVIPADGCGTIALDLRGTFSLTLVVEGTVDGINWTQIPMKGINTASVRYVATITGAVTGMWMGTCSGYTKVKVRCSAYTSGAATVEMTADLAALDLSVTGNITTDVGMVSSTAGAAVTLTLASPGAGLRHYLTFIRVMRFATVNLVASATPTTVTTTNIPGLTSFTLSSEAVLLGGVSGFSDDFAQPIATSAQATATTIVCPVTTNVIWRVAVGYYLAP